MLAWLADHLPRTEDDLYVWMLLLMAGYLGAGYLLSRAAYATRGGARFGPTRVFDAATFAASTMLLLGIVEPSVLDAIGSTKPFLLVSGFIGLIYSLGALVQRPV